MRSPVTFSVPALLLIVTVFVGIPPAAADDAPVLVADTNNVTLTSAPDGGATAVVTIQNQSSAGLAVSASPADGASDGCDVEVDGDAVVQGHRQRALTLEFSAGCEPESAGGTDFTVVAGEATFDLHADPPAAPDPNWWIVALLYGVVAIAAGLVLLGTWRKWTVPSSRTVAKDLSMALPGLDATWKFSDSWAANATVLTALFSGVFGAKEVATALLADEADEVLAIALVSAAVSVGLVALGPMVIQASKKKLLQSEDPPVGEDGKHTTAGVKAGLYVTPLGLLLAAFCTLTATGGQLAALLYAVAESGFGQVWVFVIIGALAAGALVWYARAATDQSLTVGATVPPLEDSRDTHATVIRLPADDGPRLEAAGREPERTIAIVLPAQTASVPGPGRKSAIL